MIPPEIITHSQHPPEQLNGLSERNWNGLVAFYELVTGDAVNWIGPYSDFQQWLRETISISYTSHFFTTSGDAYVSLCLQHMAMEYTESRLHLHEDAEQFISGAINDLALLQIYLEKNPQITFDRLVENEVDLVHSLSADLLSRPEGTEEREKCIEQLRIATERSSHIKPEHFVVPNQHFQLN